MATKIADVMTDRPRAVTSQTSVREAARLMEEEDVGSLPVVDDGARLVGIVTDRDVAVRVVGRGLDPDSTSVGQVATSDLVALTPEHDLDEALTLMAREQVRRLPIVVRENELVGMLSQADVARVGKEKATGEVVEAISQRPRGPRVAGSEGGGSGVGAGSNVAGVRGSGDRAAQGQSVAQDQTIGRDEMAGQPPVEQQDEGRVR